VEKINGGGRRRELMGKGKVTPRSWFRKGRRNKEEPRGHPYRETRVGQSIDRAQQRRRRGEREDAKREGGHRGKEEPRGKVSASIYEPHGKTATSLKTDPPDGKKKTQGLSKKSPTGTTKNATPEQLK